MEKSNSSPIIGMICDAWIEDTLSVTRAENAMEVSSGRAGNSSGTPSMMGSTGAMRKERHSRNSWCVVSESPGNSSSGRGISTSQLREPAGHHGLKHIGRCTVEDVIVITLHEGRYIEDSVGWPVEGSKTSRESYLIPS